MESITKKKGRKLKRKFNTQWRENIFILCQKLFGSVISLIGTGIDNISVCKEYNIKHHYRLLPNRSQNIRNLMIKEKNSIEELTNTIRSVQACLQKNMLKLKYVQKLVYLIAEKLAEKGKPLVDGELI